MFFVGLSPTKNTTNTRDFSPGPSLPRPQTNFFSTLFSPDPFFRNMKYVDTTWQEHPGRCVYCCHERRQHLAAGLQARNGNDRPVKSLCGNAGPCGRCSPRLSSAASADHAVEARYCSPATAWRAAGLQACRDPKCCTPFSPADARRSQCGSTRLSPTGKRHGPENSSSARLPSHRSST